MNETQTPFSRHHLALDQGNISYLAGGKFGAMRLLFLHATGFNAQTYRVLLAPLCAEFDIRVVDARGHGLTTLHADPAEQTSWYSYADDLSRFVDVWSGPPVILCGHSMGGTVGLLKAARMPDRVRGLVMLDPPIAPRDAVPAIQEFPLAISARKRRQHFGSKAEMFSAYHRRGAFKSWPDEVLHDYIDGGTRQASDGGVELTCAPAWEAATFTGQTHDSWRAIRNLTAPALLMRAEHESPTRISSVDELHTENPQIDVRTVSGASHFFPMDMPDLVRSALIEFAGGV